MAVKVLISRRIKRGEEKDVLGLLHQLRIGGMNQPGYVTGETLFSAETSRKMVVVSTWESSRHWERWRNDPVRKSLENRLDQLLEEPASYEIFYLGTSSS